VSRRRRSRCRSLWPTSCPRSTSERPSADLSRSREAPASRSRSSARSAISAMSSSTRSKRTASQPTGSRSATRPPLTWTTTAPFILARLAWGCEPGGCRDRPPGLVRAHGAGEDDASVHVPERPVVEADSPQVVECARAVVVVVAGRTLHVAVKNADLDTGPGRVGELERQVLALAALGEADALYGRERIPSLSTGTAWTFPVPRR